MAVNRAVIAAHLPPTADALVETWRALARQMDASGGNPSTRLSVAYLSAGRDFQRMLAARTGRRAGVNPLDELRAKREERDAG